MQINYIILHYTTFSSLQYFSRITYDGNVTTFSTAFYIPVMGLPRQIVVQINVLCGRKLMLPFTVLLNISPSVDPKLLNIQISRPSSVFLHIPYNPLQSGQKLQTRNRQNPLRFEPYETNLGRLL